MMHIARLFSFAFSFCLFFGGAAAQQGVPPSVPPPAPLGGCIYIGGAFTLGNGQQAGFTCLVDGSLRVAVTSGGSSGAASGTGGVAAFSRIPASAASTNATSAKTSAGRVYKIYACNTTTTAKFVKFFNKSSAPVPGTDTVLFSRVLPPSATAGVPLCQSFDQADIGWSFSTGIAYAITGANADNDATALAAGDVTQVSVEYQ